MGVSAEAHIMCPASLTKVICQTTNQQFIMTIATFQGWGEGLKLRNKDMSVAMVELSSTEPRLPNFRSPPLACNS